MTQGSVGRFGRYSVLGKWASGGMAEILVARQGGDYGFDKLVALKLIRQELASERHIAKMFLAEARTGALLTHPNIVQTYDVGRIGKRLYMAMEFVQGESLATVIAKLGTRRLPVPLAVSICKDVASALHYAHTLKTLDGTALDLVHRDVSPSNIMLTHDGGVKLLDFGIAKVATVAGLTKGGAIKGKAAYLSPEQAQTHHLDGRSDVFSLGLVLWELLVGHAAFDEGNLMQVMFRLCESDVPAPTERGAKCDVALNEIVGKALERDPEKRYKSARAFAQALNRYLKKCAVEAEPEDEIRKLMHKYFGERTAMLQGLLAAAPDTSGGWAAAPDLSEADVWVLPTVTSIDVHAGTPSPSLTPVAYTPRPDGGASGAHLSYRTEPARATTDPGAATMMVSHAPDKHRLTFMAAAAVISLAALAVAAYFYLSAKPAGDAHLAVTSEPSGAIVTIEGRDAGTTPLEIDVPVGRNVDILVKQRGYETYHESVTLDRRGGSVHAALEVDEVYGSAVIKTTPPGASVMIDGEALPERTPVVLSNLWVGMEHTVVLSLEDHVPQTSTFSFDDMISVDLTVRLVATDQGYVAARCVPSPCDVQVNGEHVATTPLDSFAVDAGLPTSVQLIQNGAIVRNETLRLGAGELHTIEFIVEPPKPAITEVTAPVPTLAQPEKKVTVQKLKEHTDPTKTSVKPATDVTPTVAQPLRPRSITTRLGDDDEPKPKAPN